MELMSSLLLCALVVLLPQVSEVKASLADVKRNTTKVIETPIPRKTVWLSSKIQSKVTLQMVMQSFQDDWKCRTCIACMNRSINSLTANKASTRSKKHMSKGNFLMNDIVENYHQRKYKREVRSAEGKTAAKVKRSQVSKSKNVSVTKYNIDGQVYAIKIREGNSTELDQKSDRTCQVYSVKKYHPCDTPKADLIFTNAKRKANKRSKKQAKAAEATDEPQSADPQPRGAPRAKVLAEPFMTSIEELYN